MAYNIQLLSYALAVTMDLKYEVPLKVVYKVVEAMDKNGMKNLKVDEITEMIKTMGSFLKKKVLNSDDEDAFVLSDDSLANGTKEKLLYLLQSLGCELEKDDLNKVLSGKLKIEDVASRKVQMAWCVFFDKNGAKFSPNQNNIDLMLLLMRFYTLQDIYEIKSTYQLKLKEAYENLVIDKPAKENFKIRDDDVESKKIEESILEIEKKIKMLRRYIAHMQGYDRDLDRDGTIGINWDTGYVIDFEDIGIADGYFELEDVYTQVDNEMKKVATA